MAILPLCYLSLTMPKVSLRTRRSVESVEMSVSAHLAESWHVRAWPLGMCWNSPFLSMT
jgi:hypothetical protein